LVDSLIGPGPVSRDTTPGWRLAAGLGNVAHTAFISLTNDRGLTGLQDKLDRRFNAFIFN
jgi:hypothetical protein